MAHESSNLIFSILWQVWMSSLPSSTFAILLDIEADFSLGLPAVFRLGALSEPVDLRGVHVPLATFHPPFQVDLLPHQLMGHPQSVISWKSTRRIYKRLEMIVKQLLAGVFFQECQEIRSIGTNKRLSRQLVLSKLWTRNTYAINMYVFWP